MCYAFADFQIWIFDQPDGGGRLLRQRSGHGAPPHKIRFHGNTGQNVLSAGQDSTLRSFSTVHDRHNKSLGRASFNKAETKKAGLKKDQHMMPPITEFDSGERISSIKFFLNINNRAVLIYRNIHLVTIIWVKRYINIYFLLIDLFKHYLTLYFITRNYKIST